jgi:hypothetical protein
MSVSQGLSLLKYMNNTIPIVLRKLPCISVLFLGLVIQSCGTFLFPEPQAPKAVLGREVLWKNHFETRNYDGNINNFLSPAITLGKDYPRLPPVSGVHWNYLYHRMPHRLGLLEYFQGRVITWNAATGKLERYSEFLNPNPGILNPTPYYLGGSTMIYVAGSEVQGNKMTGVDLQTGRVIWEHQMGYRRMWNLYGVGETFFFTHPQIGRHFIIIRQGRAIQGLSENIDENKDIAIPLQQNGEYLFDAFDALPFLHPQSQDTMLFVCANIGRNLVGQMYDSVHTEYFLYNASKRRIEVRKRLLEGKEQFFSFRSVYETFFQSSEHILVGNWVKSDEVIGINKVTGRIDWKERILYNTAAWETVRNFIVTENYFAYHALSQSQIRVHDTRTGKLLWSISGPSADDVHLCILNNVLYYASKLGTSTDTVNVWAGVDLATGKHIFHYRDGIDGGSVYEMVARDGVIFARVEIAKVIPPNPRSILRPWQEDTYLYAIKAVR